VSHSTRRPGADGIPDGDFIAIVAGIWADVLQVPVGSPYDDFFELGGHSMLASRAVAVVRREVAPATMRMLFDHPRLRDFCARLDAVDAVPAR